MTTSAAQWPGPPRADAEGRLEVAGFNRYLEAHPRLARSPLRAAIDFARPDRPDAATTSVVAKTTPEGRTRAVVVLTASGLLDDSVRATRYTLVFANRSDTWRLVSARVVHRCWPGRGQQRFSPRPCV